MRHIGNVHTGVGSIFGKLREKISPMTKQLGDKVLVRVKQRADDRLDDEMPDLEAERREEEAQDDQEMEEAGYRRRLPPASCGEVLDAAQGFVDLLAALPMSAGVEAALGGIDALLGDVSEGEVGLWNQDSLRGPSVDYTPLFNAATLFRTRVQNMGATSTQQQVDDGVLIRVEHDDPRDRRTIVRMAQIVADENDVDLDPNEAPYGTSIFFSPFNFRAGEAENGVLSLLDEAEKGRWAPSRRRFVRHGQSEGATEGLTMIGNINDYWGNSPWGEAEDARFDDEDDFGSSYETLDYGY